MTSVKNEKSNNVTDHKKYLMFKNHLRLEEKYELKKALKHGCYRSCKSEKLSECFVYSPKNDDIYCIFCTLFLNADRKRSRSSFVNYGYSEWHNIKEKESRHVGSSYHQQAVLEAYVIIKKFENPTNAVKTVMDENLIEDWLHLASYLSRARMELFCHENIENMVKI